MSDQDLKYDLASKYADKFRTASRDDAYGSFIDGWDAARANDEEKEDLKLTEKVYYMNKDAIAQLKQEREKQQKEIESLRDQLEWSLRNEQLYKDELNKSFERENQLRAKLDQVKAQCEKLAEALEFYANANASQRIADGALAIKILAEYRKNEKGE